MQIDIHTMEFLRLFNVENVLLARRGHYLRGTLILSKFHLVFTYTPEKSGSTPREIWICYPVIERIIKARGSSWSQVAVSVSGTELPMLQPPNFDDFDKYSTSNIRIQCKDFTYYSFDFANDGICTDVFQKLSELVTAPKVSNSIMGFYAFDYKANSFETRLDSSGWEMYDPVTEYTRQNLIGDDSNGKWRLSDINRGYNFCPSYPETFVVPKSISDSVLKHAGKFRSKQRIPVVVYKHRLGENGNIIARCSQPLVGLNLQNRSIQDEKLIEEIFRSQEDERGAGLSDNSAFKSQPQRNLIVDLRPLTNAMAQHALGAGTESIENYRGKASPDSERKLKSSLSDISTRYQQHVDKIFCNIDNIHVMRDSLSRLVAILSDLDRYPVTVKGSGTGPYPLLQQSLTKTQWLHRLSIILQSVDRITKSVHLNNTNVLIHCSDGWDRTSQVSALLQLCLDPYFRTINGFMVLIEKEWTSFGFKHATRGDHGGCIGALIPKKPRESKDQVSQRSPISPTSTPTLRASQSSDTTNNINGAKTAFTSFILKAAYHIKNTASAAASSNLANDITGESSFSVYSGSSERSPIFHQFLDCVYQILRQHPSKIEFNSRFLKRLFYHYYSCQYGTFLCDSERELRYQHTVQDHTVSVWDYFLSRKEEFINKSYDASTGDQVIFFNFSDVRWWSELYGRSDEEMNGLSNSLDRKFAQLNLSHQNTSSVESSTILLASLVATKK